MAERKKQTEQEAAAAEQTEQTKQPEQDKKDGYEAVFIRRPADERNAKAKIVGINGKMYAVPYDREVKVPPAVAEVLKASQEAEQQAYEMIDALSSKVTEL